MTLEQTLVVATLLVSIGTIVSSLELASRRSEVRSAFAWDILQTHFVWSIQHPELALASTKVVSGRPFDALVWSRLALAVSAPVLVLRHGGIWVSICAGAVVLLNVLLHARLIYGLDGSDQMATIVWAGMAVYWLQPSLLLAYIALGFVGAQFALSYLTSGIAKLISKEWRSGAALPDVLASGNHGMNRISGCLRSTPVLPLTACWIVIGVECLGPPIALINDTALVVFVSLSTMFHFGVAFAMGLNLFLYSFLAALACFAWIAQQI